MALHGAFTLILISLLPILLTHASPFPLRREPSTRLTAGNLIIAGQPLNRLGSFPPGPPEHYLPYAIPDTDLAVEFYSTGRIPDRPASIPRNVISACIRESLNYRINAKMPGTGYQKQENGFLLSVSHSAGRRELTWGMWLIVLEAINGYVQAYPEWDFQFIIRKFYPEELDGYAIAAGFAKSR